MKKNCRYNGRLVHERIVAQGKVGFLINKIDHFSYRSFDHHISKINQSSWLQAKQLSKEGKKVNAFHLVIKPPVRFFIHFSSA